MCHFDTGYFTLKSAAEVGRIALHEVASFKLTYSSRKVALFHAAIAYHHYLFKIFGVLLHLVVVHIVLADGKGQGSKAYIGHAYALALLYPAKVELAVYVGYCALLCSIGHDCGSDKRLSVGSGYGARYIFGSRRRSLVGCLGFYDYGLWRHYAVTHRGVCKNFIQNIFYRSVFTFEVDFGQLF